MLSDFKPRGAIFDFDGTLADSMWVWSEVDRVFAEKRGLDFTEKHSETIAALGFEGTADYLLKEFGLEESVEDLIKEWHGIALGSYSHDVKLKPGAKEFVLSLKEQGTPVAIATSLQRVLLEPALKNNGIFDLFDAIVVCEEVCEGGKSTPAVYEEAARLINVPLNQCVVFEDVARAARSAKQGGAYVVGIRDDHKQQIRKDLIEVADLFCEDFSQLP